MKRLRLIFILIPLIGGFSPLVNLTPGQLYAQSEDLSSTVKETLKNDEILGEFSIVPLVVNGVVTLYGAVDTQEQLSRVTEIVLGISGVKSAINKVVALDSAKEEIAQKENTQENQQIDSDQVDDDEEDLSSEDTSEPEIVDNTLALPDNLPEFHIAKPGESLQEIADRYGVASQVIRRLNGMGAAQQPVAFQKIIMGGSGISSQSNVDNSEVPSSETVVLEVLGSSKSETPQNAEIIQDVDRTVSDSSPNEEARSISEEIQGENKSKENTRPLKSKPSRAEQEAMRSRSRLVEAETVIRNGWVFHRVARNENDAQIADYYNVSLAELRKKNGLRPGAALRRGSLIRVKKSNE